MIKEIRFVDVGEGITEGHVAKWLVKDGDAVKEDQPLVQVETDKAIVNVPAPISGSVRVVAPEGTTLHVGDTVAYVGDLSEIPKTQKAAAQPAKPSTPTVQQAVQQAPAKREVVATPSVRRMARELGVDIFSIAGSGTSGRISEEDVRSFAAGGAKKAPQPTAAASTAPKLPEAEGEVERIPMSQTRKAIARNMELSATIPRAVHMELVDGSALFRMVSNEKEKVLKQKKVKLTYLPFIIKAVVEALQNNPTVNSVYSRDTQEIIVKKYYNIGIAAEAPDGLKVVVIRDCDKKGIVKLAKELQELREKINAQTITLDEMKGSTFTITNIGSLGGGYLSVPMINYPEVAILGVHWLRDEAVVVDNKVVAGKVLPLSLAFDHRVVDGAEAARFMGELKGYLEDPDFLDMI